MLHIGEIYDASKLAKENPTEFMLADSAQPNYFYETHLGDSHKNYLNQQGIIQYHDQECLIISSTDHSRNTEYNPWEDEFREDIGYIHYYGDNKRADVDPSTTQGNKRLLQQFKISHSSDPKVRAKAIPILFFENQRAGERIFHGYGTIESVKLITQYNTKNQNKEYFANYLFTFCVFSLKHEREQFNWSWIDARRDHDKYAKDLAPWEWNEWIKTGDLNKVRRHVYSRNTIKKADQLPQPNSKLAKILEDIYNHYRQNPYGFEVLAKDATRLLIEDSGTKCHDGWVTKASGDGGYDYVLRVDIGTSGLSQLRQVVLGQAKCYQRDNGINGEAIDRIVARLKRGWIAAFVTTSYFSPAAQKEILDDNYPILMINGLKLAQITSKNIYQKNISLKQYLESLNREQEYKDPADILKEE